MQDFLIMDSFFKSPQVDKVCDKTDFPHLINHRLKNFFTTIFQECAIILHSAKNYPDRLRRYEIFEK